MGKLHKLDGFKNLDDLVEEDYKNGVANYSLGILGEITGLLIKKSIFVNENPFIGRFLVRKDELEEEEEGITKFIYSLSPKSLKYLHGMTTGELYIFDQDEYTLSTISTYFEHGDIINSWEPVQLHEDEIQLLENLNNQPEKIKTLMSKMSDTFYKFAENNFFAYEIKSKSSVFLEYDDGDSGDMSRVYLLKNDTAKDLIEKVMNTDSKNLTELYKNLNGRLFIKDSKNDVYSLEINEGAAEFTKHMKTGDRESIIMGRINHDDNKDMYV
jgi:hypothetical protein